uniref:Putative secreted protein n=1 Tax=Ixodes scapularis TaxID=6945 RepID=Q4PMZ7_IXOSC|nr:putative secreted protein [Ixodes scapularis]
MLLVLFAVVLILPAFQGEGFSSGIKPHSHCLGFTDPMLSLFCKLRGSKHVGARHLSSCQVTCMDRNQRLRLPREVCPSGKLTCSDEVKKKFNDWMVLLEEAKNITCG